MVIIPRTFLHMLQVAAMVGCGFFLLSLLEGGYTKRLANRFSRGTLEPPEQKGTARSRL